MRPDGAPFVERDAELETLGVRFVAAESGDPSFVVIAGEPGQGKTRLVEEFLRGETRQDGIVLFGRCAPVSSARSAFGPLTDVLHGLLRLVPDARSLVTPEVWSSLGRLVGAEADSVGVESAGVDTVSMPRMFAGFVELLSAVAREHTIVLVFEDLHWADSSSLDLLDYLARSLVSQRILVVSTIRNVGLSRQSRPRQTVSEMSRLGRTELLELAPLSVPGMTALIGTIFSELTPAQIDDVVERSEGNPFFAFLLAHQPDPAHLPPQTADLLLSAVAGQGPRARELLLLLQVLGGSAPLADLAEALALSRDDMSILSRGLVDEGLVTAGRDHLALKHALIGEALDVDMLPSERAVAHARAAEMMLSGPASNMVTRSLELAHHLLGCGRTAESIRFALRGARHALAVRAFSEAQLNFAGVLRLWTLVDDPVAAAGSSHIEVLLEAAEAERWCGDWDAATALLDSALLEARSLDESVESRTLRARIELASGQIFAGSGRLAAATDAYRRAEILSDSDPALRGSVLAALAVAHLGLGDAKSSATVAARAVVAASRVGDDRTRLHAGITEAVSAAQLGDIEGGLDRLRACLLEVRRLDDLELVLRCYGNLTFVLGVAGRTAELLDTAAEGLEVCRRYGPINSVASTLTINYCAALVTLGRWDEAREVAQAELSRSTSKSNAAFLVTELAQIATARGEWELADTLIARALDEAADGPYATDVLFVRAERALWSDEPEVAIAIVDDAIDGLIDQEDEILILDACRVGLRAIADDRTRPGRKGSSREVLHARLLEIAAVAASTTTLPSARAAALECEAEAARAQGLDTVPQWTAIADLEGELGRSYERAYALLQAGRSALRRRSRTTAGPLLAAARAIAVELRAAPLTASIDAAVGAAALAKATKTPLSTSLDRAFGVTRREHQILALLVEGLSNRAIAQQLFISERTVGVHVGNLFAKLGTANRTEAARVAVDLGLDTHPPGEQDRRHPSDRSS